ncbi:conserved hypothetical protein [Gammaproteobacteria bacterium]
MIGRYLMNLLISLDQLGNSVFAGDPDETISSRLGRIQAKYGGEIPWTRPVCRLTAWVLGKIDTNHCADAVEPGEGSDGIADTPDNPR